MTILQAILLGIVQGITEFLPVSSSAHLVIVPQLLGWDIPADEAFVFFVLVQVASLFGIIAVFWKDLFAIIRAVVDGIIHRAPFESYEARLGWLLVLATVPAGLLGISIKGLVEQAFDNPALVGVFLWVTAGLLILAERIGEMKREISDLNWKDALWIGFAQAIAIFPGISRSGATISGGIMRGFKRPAAARFAFLMSIPIMLAAGLLASKDLMDIPDFQSILPVMISGLITSAIVSYFSIRWLMSYLINRRLFIFAIYCMVLGSIVILSVSFQ